MPNNPAPLAEEKPVADHPTEKVHAALTRSSTGNEDLRELEAGLDSLQSDAARKSRIDWSRILLPIAALVVLLLIWQFYVSLGVKRRDLVPGPLDVLSQVGVLWSEGKLQEGVWTSLQRGIVGFLIAFGGAALGVLNYKSATGAVEVAGPAGAPSPGGSTARGAGRRGKARRQPLKDRLEERFRRRYDQ